MARVHVAAWRTAYAGLVAADYLAGLSIDEQTALWRARLSRPAGIRHHVMCDPAGRIVGMAGAGPDRLASRLWAAELYYLYVHPRAQGLGHGSTLFSYAARDQAGQGALNLRLWVLQGNAAARGFYVRRGGRWLEHSVFTLAGQRLGEDAYGWREIAHIAG